MFLFFSVVATLYDGAHILEITTAQNESLAMDIICKRLMECSVSFHFLPHSLRNLKVRHALIYPMNMISSVGWEICKMHIHLYHGFMMWVFYDGFMNL